MEQDLAHLKEVLNSIPVDLGPHCGSYHLGNISYVRCQSLPSNFISIGARDPVTSGFKTCPGDFFSSKYICIFTYNLHKSLVAQLLQMRKLEVQGS